MSPRQLDIDAEINRKILGEYMGIKGIENLTGNDNPIKLEVTTEEGVYQINDATFGFKCNPDESLGMADAKDDVDSETVDSVSSSGVESSDSTGFTVGSDEVNTFSDIRMPVQGEVSSDGGWVFSEGRWVQLPFGYSSDEEPDRPPLPPGTIGEPGEVGPTGEPAPGLDVEPGPTGEPDQSDEKDN